MVDDLPRLVSALDEPADPLSICLLHLARMTARAREGGARRGRRRRALRRLRPLCGRPLARRAIARCPRRSGTLVAEPGAPAAARPVHLQERHPQAPLGGPDGPEDRGRAVRGEPPVLLVQRGPPGASCTRPGSGRSCWAAGPKRACSSCTPRANADEPIDRMMYVDSMSRLPGPVAHDPRPGDDGVQPRVPLAVPRSAVRRVHGPGADLAQDRGRRLRYLERRLGERYLPPEVLAAEEAGIRLAADVHPGATRSGVWRRGCCCRASWCGTAICGASG